MGLRCRGISSVVPARAMALLALFSCCDEVWAMAMADARKHVVAGEPAVLLHGSGADALRPLGLVRRWA